MVLTKTLKTGLLYIDLSPGDFSQLCLLHFPLNGFQEGRVGYDMGKSFCFLLAGNRKASFFCLLPTTHTSPTQTQNLGIETEGKKDNRAPFLLSLD